MRCQRTGTRFTVRTKVALTVTFGLVVSLLLPARLMAGHEGERAQQTQPPGLPLSADAPTRMTGVPEARSAKVRRGINLSHWFAQVVDGRGYAKEHFLTHTTAQDLALIKALGFDHVRLSVDPEPMFGTGQADMIPPDYLRHLDDAVGLILAHDLAVVVDIHPSGKFKQRLQRDDRQVEAFADFWWALARHFSATDPERVFLEVLNEPEFDNAYRWSGVQAKLVAAIREGAPAHTAIATGHRWSALDELLTLVPLRDPNVIYNFHFYSPHLFTHQGATWGVYFWHSLRGISYPSTPDKIAALAAGARNDLARLSLVRYGHEYWSAARIEAEIAQVDAWSRKHNVRVTCNEFGVFRRVAPSPDRASWIADVRTVLERHGIGWALWDYAGDFGLVTKQGGTILPDHTIVAALGLRGSIRE